MKLALKILESNEVDNDYAIMNDLFLEFREVNHATIYVSIAYLIDQGTLEPRWVQTSGKHLVRGYRTSEKYRSLLRRAYCATHD